MMIDMQRLLQLLTLITIAIALGCGGAGSGPDMHGLVFPQVSIGWTAGTREFLAPGLATKATIQVTPTATFAWNSTWTVDRPAITSDTVETYTGKAAIPPGPVTVTVTFENDPISPGTTTGTLGHATILAEMDSAGNMMNPSTHTPLGTVSYTGDITSLRVFTFDTMRPGESHELQVYGGSATGPVVLPSNVVTTQIESGAELATVSGYTLHTLGAGEVTVKATYLGVTGTGTITIFPAIATPTRVVNPPKHLTWDSTRSTLWGTSGDTLFKIAPDTGATSGVISGLAGANQLALSTDGTVAYVGTDTELAFRKVQLASGAVGSPTYIFGAGSPGNALQAYCLSINPQNINEVAVGMGDGISYSARDFAVYRDGAVAARPSGMAPKDIDQCLYLSATSLLVNSFLTLEMDRVDVGTSLTLAQFGARTLGNITVDGTRVISSTNIYDLTTLQPLLALGKPTFPSGTWTASLLTCDTAHHLAWVLYDRSGSEQLLQAYDSQTGQMGSAVSLKLFPSGSAEAYVEMVRYGDKGMVILTNSAMYFISNAPGL